MERQRLWWAIAAAAFLFLLAASAAQAASITVDGTNCTLADAITAANTDTAAGNCPAGSGADIITLEKDVVLAAALPDITSTVTIEASGHKIDGNKNADVGSVLRVSPTSGDLTLNHATVTGGNAAGGGGIYVSGRLTLNSSTISGNAAGSGGGIYVSGRLTLNSSTISGNAASDYGGGIYGLFAKDISLNSSTVSGNSAGRGGGGLSFGSDFAGSFAVTLKSSLISGNSALSGAKEVDRYGFVSIIADSHNLFGHSVETSAEAFLNFTPGSSDINATSDGGTPTALSAILSPLADNGGPTQTHALPEGSPAVNLDATCGTGLTTDQRGTARPATGCDAGAYEYVAPTSVNFVPVYELLLRKGR